MGVCRYSVPLVLVAACFEPLPPEGAPCATSADCPAPLACYADRCLAEPPAGDPDDPLPPPPDDPPPANAACPEVPEPLQCDGFESGDLSAWTQSRSVDDAILTISGEQVHSGTRALEAAVPAQTFTGSSAYVSRVSAPQATGLLAARAWIYAPQAIDNFSGVLRFGDSERYVMVAGDNNELWTVTENSSAGLFDHRSEVAALPERWTCVELVYSFAGPTVELYIDGAKVLDKPTSDPAPAYSEASVGVTRAPLAGFRVFVDDFVVANQRIGCD